MRIALVTLLGIVAMLPPHTARAQDVRKVWMQALKSCGKNDLVGDPKKVLFFGPTNSVGVGSVWRKADEGYALRFQLSDLLPDAAARGRAVVPGKEVAQCDPHKTIGWNLKAGLPFLATFLPTKGVDAQFGLAKKATVSVDKLNLDLIAEVPFKEEVNRRRTANKDDVYVQDLFAGDRYLVTRAYRVSGLTYTLDYQPEDLAKLKEAYQNGATVTIGGDKGASFTVAYAGNKGLTLKLASDVYIAGGLDEPTHVAGNLTGGGSLNFDLVPVTVLDNQKAVADKTPLPNVGP